MANNNKLFTQVQHRRGISTALQASVNKGVNFLKGEIVLEDIGANAAHWVPSHNDNKYLIRIGTGGTYDEAACLWAHAVDVGEWVKASTLPKYYSAAEGSKTKDIVGILDKIYDDYHDLADTQLGTSINNALADLDYTKPSNAGDYLSSFTQENGLIKDVQWTTFNAKLLADNSFITLNNAVTGTDGISEKLNEVRVEVLGGTLSGTTVKGLKATYNDFYSNEFSPISTEVGKLRNELGTKGTDEDTAFAWLRKISTALGTNDNKGALFTRVASLEGEFTGDNNIKTRISTVEEALNGKGDKKGLIADVNELINTTIPNLSNNVIGSKEADKDTENGTTSNKTAFERIADVRAIANDVNSRLTNIEDTVENFTNVMNFRGAVSSFAEVNSPKAGDVITFKADYKEGSTVRAKAGSEWVYVESADSGEWIEIGTASATDAAVNKVIEDLDNLTNNVIGDAASDPNGSGTVFARIATARASAKTANDALGTNDNKGTVFNRLQSLEGVLSGNDGNSVIDNIQELEKKVGAYDYAGRQTTIGAELVKVVNDLDTLTNDTIPAFRIGTPKTNEGSNLWTEVYDLNEKVDEKILSTSKTDAIAYRLNTVETDLNGVAGSETAIGIKKTVNNISTDLGNKTTASAITGNDAFAKIKTLKDVIDGLTNGSVSEILTFLTNGLLSVDAASKQLKLWNDVDNPTATDVIIDCGVINGDGSVSVGND